MDRAVSLPKAVKHFGGYSELARRLTAFIGEDVPLSTVHGWARRKRLPHWRAREIAALAKNENIDVFKMKKKRRTLRAKRRVS